MKLDHLRLVENLLQEPSYSSFIWLDRAFQVANILVRDMLESIVPIETDYITHPRPRLRPQICDPDLVQNWLRRCREHHGGRCIVQPKAPMTCLRLVDVFEERISSFTQSSDSDIPPYASLSWAWGPTKGSDGLTTHRLFHARKKGFLKSSEMPVTISDATTFLRGLGIVISGWIFYALFKMTPKTKSCTFHKWVRSTQRLN